MEVDLKKKLGTGRPEWVCVNLDGEAGTVVLLGFVARLAAYR